MQFTANLLAAAAAISTAAAAPASPCSPVELVWARGSIEPQASFGPFVGDGFIAALRKAVPEMTYYNVVYPASMGAQSPATGVADTIKHITQQSAQCPKQKFVIGGYSQGAVVMHRAAVQLSPEILSKIIATATFGDGGQQTSAAKTTYNSPVGPIPRWPAGILGKEHYECVPGDNTCTPGAGALGIVSHISYRMGNYVPNAAKFVKEKWQAAKGK